eukprot:m.25284 g.25284  ORF g.25284 m.25284 type:complete len:645 (-) comp4140_c0_seq2:811-2745(-)
MAVPSAHKSAARVSMILVWAVRFTWRGTRSCSLLMLRALRLLPCLPRVRTLMDTTTLAVPAGFQRVCEGKAAILFSGEVFYNPVQEFNRDLSILVLNTFSKILANERAAKAEQRALAAAKAAAAGAAPRVKKAKDPNADDEEDEQEPIKSPADGMRIMEALSATGLRSIRYFREIEGVKQVIANDFSADAVAAIRRNIEYNGLSAENDIIPSHADASMIMYQHRQPASRFEVVDLDPYGSAAPFLDAAIQSVADGGILCVTCTDMAILAGNHTETCHAKYGATALRSKACHEMALRIVLSSISSHASRYRRYITPLMSCSIDFYVRIFVRVHTSAALMKRAASKVGSVYQCTGCDSFALQPNGRIVETGKSIKFKPAMGPPVDRHCDECGNSFHIGGPIWLDPIHDVAFVRAALAGVSAEKYKTHKRITGMLNVIAEELPEVPLYYTLAGLTGHVHTVTPPMLKFRSALMNLGYRVSTSHANPLAIKTDAPTAVVWDVMRCWVRAQPVKVPKERKPKEIAAAADPAPDGEDIAAVEGSTTAEKADGASESHADKGAGGKDKDKKKRAKDVASDPIATRLLAKEPTIQADFTLRADANPDSRKAGLARFPEHPPNWGPKARAKRRKAEDGASASEDDADGAAAME